MYPRFPVPLKTIQVFADRMEWEDSRGDIGCLFGYGWSHEDTLVLEPFR